MSTWTQPICGECYSKRYPERRPVSVSPGFAEPERCCDCGAVTHAGIYLRVDPQAVAYPRVPR